MTAFKGPLDFYFYEPTSQHGDFNKLTVYIAKIWCLSHITSVYRHTGS